jgi:hypothetical protein
MRTVFAAAVLVPIMTPALAQTQRTGPSAYPTTPTLPSAWATAPLSPCSGRGRGYDAYSRSSFNPTSPCYSGSPYPSYSAVEPFEFTSPTNQPASQGSASLTEDQAKSRMEAKGYNVSGLERDERGIWRGKATLEDGRPVVVTLDLEGNIYSTLSRLYVGPPSNR